MNTFDTARRWIADDPDPETRKELRRLIETRNTAELESRFAGRLRFGTAGLRGLLGAGPARMNRVTVAQATAGFCAWLQARVPEVAARGICIGRDARPKSDLFERDVIEVATGAGVPARVFDGVVPTPVLAFAVLRLGAAGGVMITASHNPPGYNGYKVYGSNGAQIVPPDDAEIAKLIEEASQVSIPRLDLEEARARDLVESIDDVRQAYVDTIASEAQDLNDAEALRIAYTALHGVAERTLRRVFDKAGFEDFHSVLEQSAPDGSFPTVAFPNPEEPGAMDRVLRLGAEVHADLVLANDPDGDRVAAAAMSDGGYDVLSGNDIGLLLADDLLSRADPSSKPLVLSTVVSSPLMRSVAAAHGARWEQTLTGHKWIQNRALDLAAEGYSYVFGYEEALGYAASPAVRDKDGISAALKLADLALRAKSDGKTLLDLRDDLWRRHGYCAERQVSIRFDGSDPEGRMRAVVDRVRENPPTTIGGVSVTASHQPDTDVLVFELAGGHRVMLRPSGTEPKLKYYFYVVGLPSDAGDLEASKAAAIELVDAMVADLTASDC